ncbi:MAG TPA: hypothetical protein VGM23_07235, partial [Armatimonadota bacterium]
MRTSLSVFVKVLLVAACLLSLLPAHATNPSVLILMGTHDNSMGWGDFTWFNELHDRGIDIDVMFANERTLNWDLLSRYNCLIVSDLPLAQGVAAGSYTYAQSPYREGMIPLLDQYVAAGGGIFFLPDFFSYWDTEVKTKNLQAYTSRWGATFPVEYIDDTTAANKALHPRNTLTFLHTTNITSCAVTSGVSSIWFPILPATNYFYHRYGQPIEVTNDWTSVVKGSPTSYTVSHIPTALSQTPVWTNPLYRANQSLPPTLFAIRELTGGGRLAVSTTNNVLHLLGGTGWIHNRALLSTGLNGTASHFDVLFENTVRWLAAPSLQSGSLGGYTQDPLQLIHPNKRHTPNYFFNRDTPCPAPTPHPNSYQGLIGARTAYSGGTGTVAQYAAAARAAGLQFVVFLEPLGSITEANYRQLEADCTTNSDSTLLLIPGLRMANNIGNPMFAYGQGLSWPTANQLTGLNNDQLRLQCFDAQGLLAYSDEQAKNWIWDNFFGSPLPARNVGYYDFSTNPGVPIRNLRLYGILGVMTYRNGQLVEDRTEDYRDYMADGDPPLACAIDLVESPTALTNAVTAGHYLTHVNANALADLPAMLCYGHQYGHPSDVYASGGPVIRNWVKGGTYRVQAYAGESFLPVRARVRPRLWVTSTAGINAIEIYSEKQLFRKILCNGATTFDQQFEWAYDRQRVLSVVVTDVNGKKAIGTGLELWTDANYNTWCGDRQNGLLWHGPATFPAAGWPQYNQGPTWDGGPVGYIGGQDDCHPGLRLIINGQSNNYDGRIFGMGGRIMEGNMYPTCFDDNVTGIAIDSEYNYAPGAVGNAYSTLGPITPSTYLKWSLKSMGYNQRIVDVGENWQAFPQRGGGNATLLEGTLTLRQAANIQYANLLSILPTNFATGNTANWAIRTSPTANPVSGTSDLFWPGHQYGNLSPTQQGGYAALIPTQNGNIDIVFNLGTNTIQPFIPLNQGYMNVFQPSFAGQQAANATTNYKLLVVHDSLDQTDLSVNRIEQLWHYLGVDGTNGCSISVTSGGVVSQIGVVEMQPSNYLCDFTVPNPGWDVNIPLPIQFTGFNPNWTIGEYQLAGYSPGFYTDGSNVYRNLGPDDQGKVHLAVYPDKADTTHIQVGHPITCGNADLIIEVTMLNDNPYSYRVAVNNPTSATITTTLHKN